MKLPKGLSIRDLTGMRIARLYETDICSITTRDFSLNSGGWKTRHTKKCMNLILKQCRIDAYVYQEKGEWYVDYNGRKLTFNDGMRLDIH